MGFCFLWNWKNALPRISSFGPSFAYSSSWCVSSSIVLIDFDEKQEEAIQLPMTSGCPWIGGSLVLGANNALQAASDYASFLEQTQEMPEKN